LVFIFLLFVGLDILIRGGGNPSHVTSRYCIKKNRKIRSNFAQSIG
jgi:hypothetical protein